MRTLRTVISSLTVLAVVVSAAGCDSSSSPTAPTRVDPAPLTLMARALQDEYHAETIYQGVVNDFGPVLPFSNILIAETRHSTAIGRLYASRGLPTPVSEWTIDRVPRFDSLPAACAAGAAAERENIAMYDELLAADLPLDVRQVFTNNRAASASSHLPAFESCA